MTFPATAIIATLDRRERLLRTLRSLLAQDCVPAEIIIIDASATPLRADTLPPPAPGCSIQCLRADERGAAVQRNQGFAVATQPFILFLDDDVDLEPGCLRALWSRIDVDPSLGGCSAVITNQTYHPPGTVMRRILGWLGCPTDGSLAGTCCGPALNFLPAAEPHNDNDDRVDWLNLGCTLYRSAVLPHPPLLAFFHGYSLMEDAALALHVGRRWRLAAPRNARIFHDTQPAAYKDRVFTRERMEVINRWFVMRMIVGHRSLGWDLRQLTYQALMLLLPLRRVSGWMRLPAALAGKIAGVAHVVLHRRSWRGYPSLSPSP